MTKKAGGDINYYSIAELDRQYNIPPDTVLKKVIQGEIRVGIVPSLEWEFDISYKDEFVVSLESLANPKSQLASIKNDTRPGVLKGLEGVWLLLEQEAKILVTQKSTGNGIHISALEPSDPNSEIETAELGWDEYHSNIDGIVTIKDLVITEEQCLSALLLNNPHKPGPTPLSTKQLDTMYEICDSLYHALNSFKPKLDQLGQKNFYCPDGENDPDKLTESIKQKILQLAELKSIYKNYNGKPVIGTDTSGIIGLLKKKGLTDKSKSTLQHYISQALKS